MNLPVFVTFYLFNCFAAPDQTKWNEVLNFISPSSEGSIIYEQARNDILLFYRSEFNYNKNAEKVSKFFSEFVTPFNYLCDALENEDLLKSMLFENSYHFLIITWFSFIRVRELLAFNNINSLFFPKDPFSPTTLLEQIFDNFKIILSQTFVEMKSPCCEKSPGVGPRALKIFRFFWHNKLELLGRKMLNLEKLKKWKSLIEERLHFLDAFIEIDSQSLLIREYRKLRQETRNGVDKITTSIRNFCFLIRHFGKHLRNVQSSEFLSNFEWLASRSPIFLIYFFYFYQNSHIDDYPDELSLNIPVLVLMQYSVGVFLNLREGGSFIFGTLITESIEESEKILWLASRIIHKTKNADLKSDF